MNIRSLNTQYNRSKKTKKNQNKIPYVEIDQTSNPRYCRKISNASLQIILKETALNIC